jgi:hypothetical protein
MPAGTNTIVLYIQACMYVRTVQIMWLEKKFAEDLI